MSYDLHPGAERDIAEALDFYTAQAGRRVAARFLDEFERVARLIAGRPDLGTPLQRGRRSFPLSVFPYAVVYRTTEHGLRILVVRHHHRKPGYASRRD